MRTKAVPVRIGAALAHSSGVTRGLDHASRIHPTCRFQVPKSGEPDFGAVHPLRKTRFAKKMDCRLKAGNDGGEAGAAILRPFEREPL